MLSEAKIIIISSNTLFSSHLQLRLQSRGYQPTAMVCNANILGILYTDPPDLLIFDLSTDTDCSFSIISTLRNDSYFSIVPFIGLLDTVDSDPLDWEKCPLDDFIKLPLDYNELFSRVSLAFSRLDRIFDNNPLTRLPGNASTQIAIESALGSSMAVCYVDIDNFKPYNDAYGFSHGDEVIRMTARIIFNTVRDAGGGFCGHIGGDDFVCIVPQEKIELTCQTIINHFDLIILDLFDDETKQRGFYFGTNRKGEIEHIPLLSLSIGVVPMNMAKLNHVAMVTEIAAELKKLAKRANGSCYVVDKRAS
jgi:GGDEF domain-containing protein